MMMPTMALIANSNFIFFLFFFLFFAKQKRRERGRVSIRGIRLVEPAVLNLDGGDSLAPDVSQNIDFLCFHFFLPSKYGFSLFCGFYLCTVGKYASGIFIGRICKGILGIFSPYVHFLDTKKR